MTLKDTAQDVLLGSTIGAVTGPIGAGASSAAKGASGLVKFGIRVGAGAAAGEKYNFNKSRSDLLLLQEL